MNDSRQLCALFLAGVGVSAFAQGLFDGINKTMECVWDKDQIRVVKFDVLIRPPYGDGDVGVVEGVDPSAPATKSAYERVKLVVSGGGAGAAVAYALARGAGRPAVCGFIPVSAALLSHAPAPCFHRHFLFACPSAGGESEGSAGNSCGCGRCRCFCGGCAMTFALCSNQNCRLLSLMRCCCPPDDAAAASGC